MSTIVQVLSVLHATLLTLVKWVMELQIRVAAGCLQWGKGRILEVRRHDECYHNHYYHSSHVLALIVFISAVMDALTCVSLTFTSHTGGEGEDGGGEGQVQAAAWPGDRLQGKECTQSNHRCA